MRQQEQSQHGEMDHSTACALRAPEREGNGQHHIVVIAEGGSRHRLNLPYSREVFEAAHHSVFGTAEALVPELSSGDTLCEPDGMAMEDAPIYCGEVNRLFLKHTKFKDSPRMSTSKPTRVVKFVKAPLSTIATASASPSSLD